MWYVVCMRASYRDDLRLLAVNTILLGVRVWLGTSLTSLFSFCDVYFCIIFYFFFFFFLYFACRFKMTEDDNKSVSTSEAVTPPTGEQVRRSLSSPSSSYRYNLCTNSTPRLPMHRASSRQLWMTFSINCSINSIMCRGRCSGNVRLVLFPPPP